MSMSRLVNLIVSYIAIIAGAVAGHLIGKRVASPVRETVGMSPAPENEDVAAETLTTGQRMDPRFIIRNIIPGVAAATAFRTFGLSNPILNGIVAFAVNFVMTVFSDTRAAKEGRSVLKRVSPLGPLVG